MLNPGHLHMENNALLEDLTQKYPYFSISHILLVELVKHQQYQI